MIPTLRLGQLNRRGQVVSVYRTFYPPGHRYPLHRHDFAEIFFIESGAGTQWIHGRAEPLRTGDLGFVDPDAEHALAALPDSAMVLTNLAFSRRFLDEIHRFVDARHWPWTAQGAPVLALDEPLQAFMVGWIERLSAQDVGRTELAAFALDLIRRLREGAGAPPTAPRWLADAVAIIDRPEALAAGAAGLARLCGRGQATVGRTVRAHYGCTTIQLVNRRRMAWLARQLRLTREPIAALAEACGLPNLSNCYRLFRATFDCSPARYRQRFQGGVVEGA